jgi:hypothetical protein
MKFSLRQSLFTLAVMSLSPAVLAQYAGTVGDLNTVFDPPMNINATLCDNFSNDPSKPHDYKACSDGVGAARWMAEKYAKNTGKYLGCLDGFYQGVADGYNAGRNPTPAMTKEAEAYVKGATFTSAVTRGLDRARAEGKTVSADQIINRYRAVVGLRDNQGRQVLPNKTYELPEVNFPGFDDGYQHDILRAIPASEFQAVYATGWVNANSSFEDRVKARRALALQKEYANSLCNQNDTVFGRRGMPVVTIWDFFRANRQYNFQSYGWRNPDWAWEIFDRDERTLEQYQTFNRLNSLTKVVTRQEAIYKERLKLDANNQPIPVKDAAGLPIPGKFEMETYIDGYRQVTSTEKLSDAEIQTLKNIYIQAFKTAYDRFYARQYASINYHTEGMEKYKIAKIIGQAAGQEFAGHIAREDAYNEQYRSVSRAKYAEEVKDIYKKSFDRLIDIFQNNPVIELNEALVVGQTVDGIFRPGEELKVQFAVTNLGEAARGSSINFETTQDVIATSQAGFSFTAPVLSRSNYVTNTLGRVTDNRQARERINLGMVIKNPGDLAEVAKSLVVRKESNILLNDYTEINKVSGNLDIIQGRLSLLVDVINPAQGVSSPISDLEVSLGNMGQVTRSVEPIAPGATRQVVLNVEDIDPLALIITGSVSGNVNARIAGKVAHRQAVSYNINIDRSTAVVQYLDALAVNRTSNTGREGKADRIAKLQGMIEQMVLGSIEANVSWNREVGGTILATVQNVYNESKRAGRINDEAQAIYDNLGKILAVRIKDRNFRGGGFLRSEKKNKEAYLKEIAKFAKISTRVKDY